MLLPTRIEVRNIRSITHAVVEPCADGITALVGRAGSGKSSIVNALLWALFGEVGGIPGLLSQSDMRRLGCGDDAPVEAIVDFTLHGDTYRAVRRLRRTSRAGRPVEVASAELWIGGVKQSQITPSKLTEKVVALTGLSGRAYAGAFFCAQFHLPALAEGTPAEVQRIIEDQTGLSALTRKLEGAKAAAKEAQITADSLPGSVEEVEAAQAEVDTAQADGERLWLAFQQAEERAEQTRTVWEAARTEHSTLVSRQRAAHQAQLKIVDATARIEALDEQITALAREAELLPKVDAAQVNTHAGRLRSATTDAQRSQHMLETATTGLADATAAVTAAEQTLHQFPADLNQQHQRATIEQTDLQSQIGATQGEYQRLTRAIDAIRAAGPATAECPTCDQHLPDAHQLLVDLIAQRDSTAARGSATRQQLAAADEQVTHLTEQRRRQDQAHDQLVRARKDYQTAQARHVTVTQAATAALTQLQEVTGGDRITDPDRLIEAAQQQLDATAARAAAAERSTQISHQISTHQAARSSLEQGLAEARITAADRPADEAVVAAEARAADAYAGNVAADKARQEAETAAKVAAERVRSAEAVRDRTTANLDAKINALTKADTLRHAAGLLAALRKDLLADYTGTISDAATALMQQVGGGDHVGVIIDDTFVPRVILSTGVERPMRVLSGGEKMRAALCLRLGITDQITGATGAGMIVADEITANQDEDTTQEIVDLIRRLGRPILMIAHAPQVTQVANRVYEFSKNGEASGTAVTRLGTLAAPPTTTVQVTA